MITLPKERRVSSWRRPAGTRSSSPLCFWQNALRFDPPLRTLRTSRPSVPVIYDNRESFTLGNFKEIKKSKKDKAVIIGTGITTHEALKAYNKLKKKKISAAVVDLYCIKPFNSKKLINFVKKHGNKLVIVEDHYPEGGIGEMLSEGLENSGIKIKHLAVRDIPHSGKKNELLKKYGISWQNIVREVKKL